MKNKQKTDIALIGGGIMSATLGVLLKLLEPSFTIHIYERLDDVAKESSDAWNNAGTGHSAFCELNYTPQKEDGTVDISKAIKICEQFEISKEFWTYAVENNFFENNFIHPIPHYSFVTGEKNVNYLQKRFEALSNHHFFSSMEFTTNATLMQQWFPLVMNGRNSDEPIAANRISLGTDVNFGALTKNLFTYLDNQENTTVYLNHHVKDIDRLDNGLWELEIENALTEEKILVDAQFVFVGAGGGALRLLNKAKIDEVDGYGGFPVGGKWLRCTNEDVINQHQAKVYGKAEIGAPPMSVPHLDTRNINGKKEMLFGPYAGFSTKFLKHGSLWDLPSSIDWDNMLPMMQAGIHNIPLTKYLIDQVRMGFNEKFEALKKYYPKANATDWELVEAGQRVQVIKKDENGGGVLEFGTELISTADGTLAGLLGASPGASTATAIMLNLLGKCFASKMQTTEWKQKLQQIVPGYFNNLKEDAIATILSRNRTAKVLGVGC